MPRILGTLLLAMVLLALASCSQSHSRDVCGDVVACDDEGSERCSDPGDAIEACRLIEGECLGWVETEACDGECETLSGEPRCSECSSECAPFTSMCSGEQIMYCEELDFACGRWDVREDCADAGQYCDDTSGEAVCTGECVSNCVEEGRTQCDSNRVMVCGSAADECLRWEVLRECPAEEGLRCEVGDDGEAECVEGCADECDGEGRLGCDGDWLVVCADGGGGCLEWFNSESCADGGMTCVVSTGGAECACPAEPCDLGGRVCDGDVVTECQVVGACTTWATIADCAALGLPCDDSTGTAECVTGAGDACDDPMVLWDFPATFSGASFDADFGSDLDFTDDSCVRTLDAADAVFAVDLEAGETLYMSELLEGMSGVNVAFDVLSICDETAACLFAADRGESEGFSYTVGAAGRYFVVVEAVDRGWAPYEIVIDVVAPEDCGDGVDNDGDGAVDCDDWECVGDPVFCTVETNCGDGIDNDMDGSTDCDDADCAGSAWCLPYEGLWELFGDGDLPDVAGHAIVFTPDAAEPAGYRWAVTDGVVDFPVDPGTGAVTTTLAPSDDSFVELTFSVFPAFDFYGETYRSVFVGTNGFVTFGAGSTAWTDYLAEHFGLPGVSALRTDLNPSAGGAVIVDELADRLVATWQGVPRFNSTAPNDVQMILGADGTIELHYVTVGVDDALIGLSSGRGVGAYPDEEDFVSPVAEDCGDGVDNDFDGAIDCSDLDCFGVDPCSIEVDCGDGLDNDADGATDCDDPDCAGPLCEPFRGYWEQFTTDDEPDIEGHSIHFAPLAADRMGYTWSEAALTAEGFPEAPGDGTVSTTLDLADNAFAEHAFTVLAGFPFYGTTYASVFVSQNGYVTFGGGSGSYENEVADHFELPSVAGYRRDLYDAPTDAIWVDEYADRVVVTYQGAMGWAGPNDFQIVLRSTGEIDLHYVAVPVLWRVTGLLGIGAGLAGGDYPPETNFVP